MADNHTITWLSESGGPAADSGRNSVEDTVSHLDAVRGAVRRKADSMAREAQLGLLRHYKTGGVHIEVGRHPNFGARTPDWYVYMKDADPGGKGRAGKNKRDRSAMSVEFGWKQTHVFGKKLASPIKHDGLNILGDVMGRAIARYTGPQ